MSPMSFKHTMASQLLGSLHKAFLNPYFWQGKVRLGGYSLTSNNKISPFLHNIQPF